MNLKKKLERYLRVNLLGPGHRLIKKVLPGPGINYTGPRQAQGNYNMLQDFISPVIDN